jgi:hypothetical protein
VKRFVAVLLLAVAIPAAGASGKTYLGGCFDTPRDQARYKPRFIELSCTVGDAKVDRVKWSKWGRRRARGRGTAYINNCKPSCVDGHFHKYRVKVRLRRARRCSIGPRRQFRQVRITFVHRKPRYYPRTTAYRRDCGH